MALEMPTAMQMAMALEIPSAMLLAILLAILSAMFLAMLRAMLLAMVAVPTPVESSMEPWCRCRRRCIRFACVLPVP